MPGRRTFLKSLHWFYASYEMGSVPTFSGQKWRSMIYLPSGNRYGCAAGFKVLPFLLLMIYSIRMPHDTKTYPKSKWGRKQSLGLRICLRPWEPATCDLALLVRAWFYPATCWPIHQYGHEDTRIITANMGMVQNWVPPKNGSWIHKIENMRTLYHIVTSPYGCWSTLITLGQCFSQVPASKRQQVFDCYAHGGKPRERMPSAFLWANQVAV